MSERREEIKNMLNEMAKVHGFDDFDEFIKDLYKDLEKVCEKCYILWEIGGRGETPLPICAFTNESGENLVGKISIEELKGDLNDSEN